MNISEVKVGVTGNDLLSMISEFVSVDGLNIDNVLIGEEIQFIGSFTKGFTIEFKAGLKVNRIEDGIIQAEISSFKLMKLGIASILRKLALKYALKAFEEKGITYEKGKVYINIKKILLDIPYIDFDIKDIFVSNGMLNAAVGNINISVKGTIIKEEEKVAKIEEGGCTSVAVINKVKDGYSLGRDYVEEKLPLKAKKVSDYIFILPDMGALIYRLLKDKRVPLKTKLAISGSLAYIVFPTDIIPNNIPFVGRIDEIAVAFFALDRIVTDVPVYVILENWEGKNDIILVIKSIIEYVTTFTGAKNVEKLYRAVDELIEL